MNRVSQFAIAILVFNACFPSSRVAAQLQGEPALLEKAAEAYKRNYEALKTWKGTAEYFSRATDEDGTDNEIDGSIRFAYDYAANQSWYVVELKRDVVVQNGVETDRIPLMTFSGLHCDQTFYRFDRQNLSLPPRSASALGRQNMKPGWNYSAFDPKFFMRRDGTRWDKFLEATDPASTKAQSTESATALDDKIVYRRTDTDLDWTLTFDLAQGGNGVSEQKINGDLKWLNTFQYHEIGGVWIPKLAESQRTEKKGDKIATKTVTIRWIENQVNDAFPEKEFELQQLGLKRGDRVFDGKGKLILEFQDN